MLDRDLNDCQNGVVHRFGPLSMPKPLRFEGRRDVRLAVDVDRSLAKQVDAAAARHKVTRAEVIRACLKQTLPSD